MTIRLGILTISDRAARGERIDLSGPALVEIIQEQGWAVQTSAVVPDEIELISRILEKWADSSELDVILTTGGTGFGIRDVTPEATEAVIDRAAPGIPEAMRSASLSITPHAMLSRSVAGIRGQTLIVNLPGSPKGAVENLVVLLPVLGHAIELLSDDPKSEVSH